MASKILSGSLLVILTVSSCTYYSANIFSTSIPSRHYDRVLSEINNANNPDIKYPYLNIKNLLFLAIVTSIVFILYSYLIFISLPEPSVLTIYDDSWQ